MVIESSNDVRFIATPFGTGSVPAGLIPLVKGFERGRSGQTTDLPERCGEQRFGFFFEGQCVLRRLGHPEPLGALDFVRLDVPAKTLGAVLKVICDPHEPRFVRGPRGRAAVAFFVLRDGLGDPDRFGADLLLVVRTRLEQRRTFQAVGQFVERCPEHLVVHSLGEITLDVQLAQHDDWPTSLPVAQAVVQMHVQAWLRIAVADRGGDQHRRQHRLRDDVER